MRSWLAVLNQGVSEYDVAYGFATSDERQSRRIRRNYETLLERTPGTTEVQGWLGCFKNRQCTNQDIIAGFVSSPEYYARSSKGNGNRAVWIVSAYEDVLRRSPSRAEVDAWLRFLS